VSEFSEFGQKPPRQRLSAGALLALVLAVLAVGYMAVMFIWAIVRLATPENWS
jgi:hypothetical protein